MDLMELGFEDRDGWKWLRICPMIGFVISSIEFRMLPPERCLI
jgi:hypothetical protein